MADCIIGIDATNGYMWTTPNLGTDWTRESTTQLIAAAGCNESNEIVAVKPDHQELTSADLGQTWSAGSLNQQGSLLAVRTVPTTNPGVAGAEPGSLLAVGTDGQLYTSPNLTSAWTKHAATGVVKDVFVMRDGTIVGVGTNDNLYTRASLSAQWSSSPVASSCCVLSACTAGGVMSPTNTLLGVGTDHNIWTRQGLNATWQATSWPSTAPTGGVIYIAVGSSGSGPQPM